MSRARQSFLSRWTTAEIMLAVLFVLAPLYYHANPGGGGLRIPNNVIIWVIALGLISYQAWRVIKLGKIRYPKPVVYVMAFPVLVTVSGFAVEVQDPMVWLFRLLFIWGGVFFFFSLLQDDGTKQSTDRVLLLILLSGLIHALIGILQFALGEELIFFGFSNGVPTSTFQQVNIEAVFMATVIVIGFSLLSRPNAKKLNSSASNMIFITVALATFVLFISGSRAGALGFTLSLFVLLATNLKRFLENRKQFKLCLLCFLIGLCAAVYVGNTRIVDKSLAISSGYSQEARLGIYEISLELIKESPIFGHGLGSFPEVFQESRPSFYSEHPGEKLINKMVTHPHNEFLLWFIETGVLGALGIIILLAGTLSVLIRTGVANGGSYTAMLIPTLVHLQVELPFYISGLSWFLFLFLLTLPFKQVSNTKEISITKNAKNLALFSNFAFTSILLTFLMHTAVANWDFKEFFESELDENNTNMRVALVNPYLSSYAYEMQAVRYLDIAISSGDILYLQLFSDWARARIENYPSPFLLEQLIKVDLAVNNSAKACEDARFAQKIYPEIDKFKYVLLGC